GTYTDSMGFVPDSPGNKSWSFIVNWNDGWSSGTIHITGTFPVFNREPAGKVTQPVSPQEPKPWGTTFTYWVDVSDPDGQSLTVSLFKDDTKYDDSQTISGSGTASWTWQSTRDDIRTHSYYFTVFDGFTATTTPTYDGPTVTKRSTTMEIQPSEFSIGINQTATMYARVRDGFDGSYPSGKTVTWSASGGTWLSQTTVATDTNGYARVSWRAPSALMNITFTASFSGDTYYDGSSASSSASTYIPTTPDFAVSVSPAAAAVNPGSSATATVTVTSINNYPYSVSLGASGLPAGVTASFSPPSSTPGYQSTMTLQTSATTPGGTHEITITGTGAGNLKHSATFWLTVSDNTPPVISNLQAQPGTFNPNAGTTAIQFNLSEQADYTITISDFNGVARRTAAGSGSGSISWSWNGRDNYGQLVRDGPYTIKVNASDPSGNQAAPAYTTVIVNAAPFQIRRNFDQARFNPSFENATLWYELSEPAASLTVGIVDSAGNPVETLVENQACGLGPRSAAWDGRSASGSPYNNGNYTLAMTATSFAMENATFVPPGAPAVTIDNTLPAITAWADDDPLDRTAGENSVSISYSIASPSGDNLRVRINIVDEAGNAVSGTGGWLTQAPGAHTWTWDGTDGINPVPDGVYRYTIAVQTPPPGPTQGNSREGAIIVIDADTQTASSSDGVVQLLHPDNRTVNIVRTPPGPFTGASHAIISQALGYMYSLPYDVTSTPNNFAPPAILTFSYNPLLHGPRLQLYRFDNGTGSWVLVENQFVDAANSRIVAEVTQLSTFAIFGIQDRTPPPAPALISPGNGAATDNTPTFEWQPVDDPSGVTYELQYSNDPARVGVAEPRVSKEGLVSWWKLDGDASDSWGSNHGEIRGASFVDGRSGQALSFDGVNDFVMVGNQPSLNFGTGDFSLSVWMRTTHPNSSFFIG
ncbi:MAG: FlgD immunoglobulin-like domain containing protein, partial [Candidatus Hadarchaeota archaeon]